MYPHCEQRLERKESPCDSFSCWSCDSWCGGRFGQRPFFSFASDTADASWTFTGQGNQITSALAPNSTVTLEVSDNGQNPISFVTRFSANFTLTYVTSIQVGASWQHLYNLDGSFAFRDASDNSLILDATFTGGSMTALGGRRSWGASGTAFGADPETNINYTLHKNIASLGLSAARCRSRLTSTSP